MGGVTRELVHPQHDQGVASDLPRLADHAKRRLVVLLRCVAADRVEELPERVALQCIIVYVHVHTTAVSTDMHILVRLPDEATACASAVIGRFRTDRAVSTFKRPLRMGRPSSLNLRGVAYILHIVFPGAAGTWVCAHCIRASVAMMTLPCVCGRYSAVPRTSLMRRVSRWKKKFCQLILRPSGIAAPSRDGEGDAAGAAGEDDADEDDDEGDDEGDADADEDDDDDDVGITSRSFLVPAGCLSCRDGCRCGCWCRSRRPKLTSYRMRFETLS